MNPTNKKKMNKEYWYYEFNSLGSCQGNGTDYFSYFIRRIQFWKYHKVAENIVVHKDVLIKCYQREWL